MNQKKGKNSEKTEKGKKSEKSLKSIKDKGKTDSAPSFISSTSKITASSTLTLPDSLETTLFDRLLSIHGSSLKRLLNIQYRMNEKICEFPSKVLYGGELKSADGVKHRTLKDLLQEDLVSKVEDESLISVPVWFIDST
jgi:DNA polymerase alpha-associated DNA helicase A